MAMNIKPTLESIMPQRAISYITLDPVYLSDRRLTQLDWGWMDSQSMAQCKKAGFVRRTDEVLVAILSRSKALIVYVYGRHDAKALVDVKVILRT
jgi:hypothetical protein